MDCVKDLPVDVLSKIVSYKFGDPEYVKIKHSEALKRIQNWTNIELLKHKLNENIENLSHTIIQE